MLLHHGLLYSYSRVYRRNLEAAKRPSTQKPIDTENTQKTLNPNEALRHRGDTDLHLHFSHPSVCTKILSLMRCHALRGIEGPCHLCVSVSRWGSVSYIYIYISTSKFVVIVMSATQEKQTTSGRELITTSPAAETELVRTNLTYTTMPAPGIRELNQQSHSSNCTYLWP